MKSRVWQPWQTAASTSVGVGVGFSVLLISVAYGVNDTITGRLSGQLIRQSHLVDVDLIHTILVLLTAVVTGAMLAQTAGATFVLGVTVMRTRREEIALRRQSGVLRSILLWEFLRSMVAACLVGGVLGELGGVMVGLLLSSTTVLPVHFTRVSVLAAFPVTITLALAATLIPAWRSANASPALLRRGS
jgi:ABC-type antimicrobial peptide transport system permease subunit